MMDPTRERFLKVIAAEVPPEAIEEIHFFHPMRSGGLETGVAVVAATGGVIDGRFIVFTARYRLTVKGPERGKWEATVKAEADAPLLTVEAVVKGVQHRAGETDAPERMSGEEARAALESEASRP